MAPRLRAFVFIALFVPLLAVVLACNDNQVDVTCVFPTLAVTPSRASVGAGAGETSFSVGSNLAWIAASDEDWLTLSPAAGTGNGTVRAAYDANPESTPRIALVVVSGGGLAWQVAVVQDGRVDAPQTVYATDHFDRPDGQDLGFLETPSTLAWARESQGATSEIKNHRLRITKSGGSYGGIDTSGFGVGEDTLTVAVDVIPGADIVDNFVIWLGDGSVYAASNVYFFRDGDSGAIFVQYGQPVGGSISKVLTGYEAGNRYAVAITVDLVNQTQSVTIDGHDYGTYPLIHAISRVDRVRMRVANNGYPEHFVEIDDFRIYAD